MNNLFTEKAKWIGLNNGGFGIDYKSPAIELRYSFNLDSIPSNAECLISGLGFYVLHLNGSRVGDDVLSPAFTAYDKTALFMRYDLSGRLRIGENVIAVSVGDGFLNQTAKDEWNFYLASWRSSPKLLFELFADGESVVFSDVDWLVRQSATTVHNAVRCGEYYDARYADGWREVGYTPDGWAVARLVNPPGGILKEMLMPPARECEALSPVAVWESEKGIVYDFGKNIAGYVGITASATKGTTATIRYSEKLSGKEIDQAEIRKYVYGNAEFSTDRYVFCGEGEETWRPSFVYHGFRYAELTWDNQDPPPRDALTAYFVHTDLKKKGSFDCSDPLMNWIYEAGVRSFLSNYQGLPLDCPHREKNGWTGDAVISSDYAVFLYDMGTAYRKWLWDMTDAQRASGQLPGIVPTSGWGYNWGAGPAWDIALLALPYNQYLETADKDILVGVIPTAEKYLEYAKTKEDADGLVMFGLSDWCPPTEVGDCKIADNRLSDSCYYAKMHEIMATAYSLASDSKRAALAASKADTIKKSIRHVFVDGKDLRTLGQGALSMLLYFDVVDGKLAEEVLSALISVLEADGYVHKVGILGMKALPNALSKYGRTDIAYKVLMRHGYPSYHYWREIGETSFCETWEKADSRNHHMYSDVVHWQIRNIAGIRNAGVAYDKVTFKPYFFAGKCSAAASTRTPRGDVGIRWEYADGLFSADITLPADTEATLVIANKCYAVKCGKFETKI